VNLSHEDVLTSPEKVEHKSLAEALVAFQAEVGTVAKDADNPFFKSKYADLPAVKAAAQPILAKHGLAVTQEPGYLVVEGKVYDTLATTVLHATGSTTSTMVLKLAKQDAQAQGSAITYARRYAFMAVLGLVADEDDDGNAASGNTRKPAQRRQKAADPDDEANAAVRQAVARVKAAAKAAQKTPAEATAYFKEKNNGASLIASTDISALTAAAEHFEALAASMSE
jgi:hypothetical protein